MHEFACTTHGYPETATNSRRLFAYPSFQYFYACLKRDKLVALVAARPLSEDTFCSMRRTTPSIHALSSALESIAYMCWLENWDARHAWVRRLGQSGQMSEYVLVRSRSRTILRRRSSGFQIIISFWPQKNDLPSSTSSSIIANALKNSCHIIFRKIEIGRTKHPEADDCRFFRRMQRLTATSDNRTSTSETKLSRWRHSRTKCLEKQVHDEVVFTTLSMLSSCSFWRYYDLVFENTNGNVNSTNMVHKHLKE